MKFWYKKNMSIIKCLITIVRDMSSFYFKSIWTRIGMDLTKLEYIVASQSSCYQTLSTALNSFFIVKKFPLWSLRSIIAHMFSFGFRSGEILGHSITSSSPSSRNMSILREVWHGVRSCWKIQFRSGKYSLIVGNKSVSKLALC